jgi:hypothetical protein
MLRRAWQNVGCALLGVKRMATLFKALRRGWAEHLLPMMPAAF